MLNQNEQAWIDAKSKEKELTLQLLDAQEQQNEALRKYRDSYNELMELNERAEEMKNTGFGVVSEDLKKKIEALTTATNNYRNEWLMASFAVNESEAVYQQNQAVIQNYGNLLNAVANGDIEEMSNAVVRMTENFQTAETANEATLQKQLDTLTQTYEMMRQGVEEGSLQISQEQMEAYEGLIADAQNELQKFKMQHVTEMKKSGLEGAAALGDTRQAYIDETGQTVESVNTVNCSCQV